MIEIVEVEIVEDDFECPELVVGHERIHCFATVAHPGEPHMAILAAPCYCCGAFEEHHESCGVYDMEPWTGGENRWYRWHDGDLTVTLVEPDLRAAAEWRRRFQPGSRFAA